MKYQSDEVLLILYQIDTTDLIRSIRLVQSDTEVAESREKLSSRKFLFMVKFQVFS